MAFQSTKRFGPISTGHRNWHAVNNVNRNSDACSKFHGYGRYVQFTFIGEVDDKSWIVDFGSLSFIKQWLETNWDHKLLLSSDDPLLEKFRELETLNAVDIVTLDVTQGWNPSIEGSCKWVYDSINPEIVKMTDGRAQISKVEIWEHEFNTAVYIPDHLA